MFVHEITLDGYAAQCAEQPIRLGTAGSYGVETLSVMRKDEWVDYDIIVAFHPPKGESVQIRLGSDNVVSVPNADALNDYLAAQYAAGTPVQIAYKLAEPVSFTATGAQSIPALSGTNTLLTDADSVSVSGRADLIHIIKKMQEK